MWNIVRTLLVALALAGFIGQSTAHATPLQVFQSSGTMQGMQDCAKMAGMDQVDTDPSANPCKNMTPDCIGKMGCAAVAPPFLSRPTMSQAVYRQRIVYSAVQIVRDGVGPPPPVFPPKHQA